jgi:hypothetical protein
MGENCLRISTHTHVPVHQPAIYGKETAAAALDVGGGGGSSCECTRWHMATSIPPPPKKKSWRCYFAFVIEDYQYVAVIGTWLNHCMTFRWFDSSRDHPIPPIYPPPPLSLSLCLYSACMYIFGPVSCCRLFVWWWRAVALINEGRPGQKRIKQKKIPLDLSFSLSLSLSGHTVRPFTQTNSNNTNEHIEPRIHISIPSVSILVHMSTNVECIWFRELEIQSGCT